MLEAAGARLITFDRPGGGRSDPLPGRRIGVRRCRRRRDRGGLGTRAVRDGRFLGRRVVRARHRGVVPRPRHGERGRSGAAPIDAEGLDFTAGMTDTGTPAADHEVQTRRAELLGTWSRTAGRSSPTPMQPSWGSWRRGRKPTGGVASPNRATHRRGMAECVRVSAEGWFDDSIAFHRPWGFDVAGIDVPVAIWHGREDTAAPIAHARWLAGHIEGCTLHELDGGHYAAYDELPTILDWLVSHAET